MFAEPPPSPARTWMIVLTVVCAWCLGGAYLWHHPLAVVAEAVVLVPPGTDPETLCNNREIVQAVFDKMSELKRFPDPITNLSNEVEKSPAKLTGKLSGRKAADGSWKLAYQAPNAEIAIAELTALITALEQQLASPRNDKAALERRQLEERLHELTLKHTGMQDDSETGSDGKSNSDIPELESEDAESPAKIQERITAAQRDLAESRRERQRLEEEFGLVEAESLAGRKLEVIVAKLAAGPIHDAVRQIDRQARLSNELKQINMTLANDSEIYGDKHPRLIELRRRFDRLLQEVGGWEQLLAESAIRDHLMASLEQVLESQHERERDLQVQIELEQSELQDRTQSALIRTRVSDTLKKLKLEIEATQLALTELDKPRTSNFTVVQTPIVNSSATMIELGWPWLAVLIGGLVCGGAVSYIPHFEKQQPDFEVSMQLPLLTVPRVLLPTPSPEASSVAPGASPPFTENLDLAQRRAARQARWQQTYA